MNNHGGREVSAVTAVTLHFTVVRHLSQEAKPQALRGVLVKLIIGWRIRQKLNIYVYLLQCRSLSRPADPGMRPECSTMAPE